MRNHECEFCDQPMKRTHCDCEQARRSYEREAKLREKGRAAFLNGAPRSQGRHYAWLEGYDEAHAEAMDCRR